MSFSLAVMHCKTYEVENVIWAVFHPSTIKCTLCARVRLNEKPILDLIGNS